MKNQIVKQYDRLKGDKWSYEPTSHSIKKGKKVLSVGELLPTLQPFGVEPKDLYGVSQGVIDLFRDKWDAKLSQNIDSASTQAIEVRAAFDDPNCKIFRRQDDNEKLRILVNTKTHKSDMVLLSVLRDLLVESGMEIESADIQIKRKTLSGKDYYLPYESKKIFQIKGDLFHILNAFEPCDHRHSEPRSVAECPPITKAFIEHLFVEEKQVNVVIDWIKNALTKKNIIIQLWIDSGGTGKSTFITNVLQPLFGKQNCALNVNQDSITSRHNSSFIKQIVYMNEINLGKGHDVLNMLKNISEEDIFTEEKNVKRRSIDNPCNVIISSNNTNGFAQAIGERRFCILKMTDTNLKNAEEISELLNVDLSTGSPGNFDKLKKALEKESEDFYWFLRNTWKITSSMGEGYKNLAKLDELENDGRLDWQILLDNKMIKWFRDIGKKTVKLQEILEWIEKETKEKVGVVKVRDHLRKDHFNYDLKLKRPKDSSRLIDYEVVYLKEVEEKEEKKEKPKSDIKELADKYDVDLDKPKKDITLDSILQQYGLNDKDKSND